MKEFPDVNFIGSFAKLSQCPQDKLQEIAFIGRSNVGKSSLINTLTKQKGLAKTSSTPGKTQLLVCFDVEDKFRIVDLPGYGYAKVSKNKRKEFGSMIRSYLENRENLWCVFVLIDVRHEPMQVDLDFLNYLGSHGIPFQIAFTKADKIGKNQIQKNLTVYSKTLKKTWSQLPMMWVTNSLYSDGVDELRKYILEEFPMETK